MASASRELDKAIIERAEKAEEKEANRLEEEAKKLLAQAKERPRKSAAASGAVGQVKKAPTLFDYVWQNCLRQGCALRSNPSQLPMRLPQDAASLWSSGCQISESGLLGTSL